MYHSHSRYVWLLDFAHLDVMFGILLCMYNKISPRRAKRALRCASATVPDCGANISILSVLRRRLWEQFTVSGPEGEGGSSVLRLVRLRKIYGKTGQALTGTLFAEEKGLIDELTRKVFAVAGLYLSNSGYQIGTTPRASAQMGPQQEQQEHVVTGRGLGTTPHAGKGFFDTLVSVFYDWLALQANAQKTRDGRDTRDGGLFCSLPAVNGGPLNGVSETLSDIQRL